MRRSLLFNKVADCTAIPLLKNLALVWNDFFMGPLNFLGCVGAWFTWVACVRGFVGTWVAWVKIFDFFTHFWLWVKWMTRVFKILAWVGVGLCLAWVQNLTWFKNSKWFKNFNWCGSKLKCGSHKLEFFLLFLIILPVKSIILKKTFLFLVVESFCMVEGRNSRLQFFY